MIDAFTTPASRLSESERDFLCANATWPGSDFHKALRAGEQQGTICLAMDRGEIVGWARTESWENWPTLEAFVLPDRRGDGVATLCAACLVASRLYRESNLYCAVFDKAMLRVASRVGLSPVLFTKLFGKWTVDWDRP